MLDELQSVLVDSLRSQLLAAGQAAFGPDDPSPQTPQTAPYLRVLRAADFATLTSGASLSRAHEPPALPTCSTPVSLDTPATAPHFLQDRHWSDACLETASMYAGRRNLCQGTLFSAPSADSEVPAPLFPSQMLNAQLGVEHPAGTSYPASA